MLLWRLDQNVRVPGQETQGVVVENRGTDEGIGGHMEQTEKKLVEKYWALKSQLGGFVPWQDAPTLFLTKKIAAGYLVIPKATPVHVEVREL